MLLNQGIEVKVVVLSDNDDPDTYILKHGKNVKLGVLMLFFEKFSQKY